jgi:hypothetical protein
MSLADNAVRNGSHLAPDEPWVSVDERAHFTDGITQLDAASDA